MIAEIDKLEKRGPVAPTGPRTPDPQVVIIGAGPYGLSASSYLKAQGLDVPVFGASMEFWADKMPENMLLRPACPASNIADPESALTLHAYETASGTRPCAPLPLETLVQYGRWFRHQLADTLDTTPVHSVRRENGHFQMTLKTGAAVRTRRVVVAGGAGPFHRRPAAFHNLPSAQASHYYEGRKMAEFAGKRVAVIGAGQGALESAALPHEAGADAEIIAEIPSFVAGTDFASRELTASIGRSRVRI